MNKKRSLLWLGGATVLALVLAVFALHREAEEGAAHYTPVSVLPGFAAHVSEAVRIHIVSKSASFDIAFVPDKGWVLPDRGDYPADFSQVRRTLIGLAALETIEPKTARADWLSYVGLDAPPQGAGTLITVSDDKGQLLASLITGNTEDIGDPSGAFGLFVRKPDDNQSFLARAVFTPQNDPLQWLDKNILSVDRSRVREVDVDPAEGTSYEVRRDNPTDANFTLDPIPKGRSVTNPGLPGDLAGAIANFDFTDVEPARDFDFSKSTRVVTNTFDDLSVTLNVIQKDGTTWATVVARALPGTSKTAKEAGAINTRANGWAFKLNPGEGELLMTARDSLLNPIASQAKIVPPAH